MHQPSHSHEYSNITVAFFLNLAFTLIEILGGFLTNSLAILSDGLHDLGDTLSLGLSWYMEKVSHRKRDQYFSYGYKRFSMLAALINSIVLITGSCLILFVAIPRVITPQEVHVPGMMGLAILGILVNGAAVLRLRRGQTMNERVITWHLLEDVFGWVTVLLISIIMMFGNFPILDPLFSIGFTLYILWNVFKNLRQTLMLFLQSIPQGVDVPMVESKVRAMPMVQDIHDTHVWSLDGAFHVLTTHIVVEDHTTTKEIISLKQQVRTLIEQLNIQHVTLEIERETEVCALKEC